MFTMDRAFTKISALERSRSSIAKRLDRAYLRDNISDFLTLEDKYKGISMRIERLNKRSEHFVPQNRVTSWNQ